MILFSVPIVYSLIVFVFGAMVGSFLNVCILRLPKGESIVSPASHCPACNSPIPFYDNIPLISYLLLRARCRFCGARISFRYFVVELLMAALAVALLLRVGLGFGYFAYFVFVASLIVITFIDLDERIVPDVISLPGIGLGLLLSIVNWQLPMNPLSVFPSPVSSLIGILLGGGSLLGVAWAYQLFTGREGMGGGDVKLLAMVGAFLGGPAIPVALFFASLVGSLVGLGLMIVKHADSKLALPFAPFLCMGAIVYLFIGDKLIDLYLYHF
ncbi:MAG: prepilin peptidase [Candidatus Binatia bacterium]